jgi:hypothetical protein
LLLDESILALERIGFEPDIVLPDGGRILGQVLSRFAESGILH